MIVAIYTHRLLLAESLRGDIETVRSARAIPADARIALLDPGNPVEDVFTLARRLARRKPSTAVIFIAEAAPIGWVLRAIECGAVGYLGKCADSEAVTAAIRAVRAGQRFFSPCAARVVSDVAAGSRLLSRREREVMGCVCEGFSTKEIARDLGVAPKTIETIRASLLRKTRSRSATALVRYSFDHHYVDARTPNEPPLPAL